MHVPVVKAIDGLDAVQDVMHDVEDMKALERWLGWLRKFAIDNRQQAFIGIRIIRSIDALVQISWAKGLA